MSADAGRAERAQDNERITLDLAKAFSEIAFPRDERYYPLRYMSQVQAAAGCFAAWTLALDATQRAPGEPEQQQVLLELFIKYLREQFAHHARNLETKGAEHAH